MSIVIVGFLTGGVILVLCSIIENIDRDKRKNMTYEDYKKLIDQGRL